MAHLRPWIPRLRGRDPCRHGVRIVPPGIQWRRPWPWARTFDHSKPTTCPSHGAAHPGCGMALDGGGMPLVPWSLSLSPPFQLHLHPGRSTHPPRFAIKGPIFAVFSLLRHGRGDGPWSVRDVGGEGNGGNRPGWTPTGPIRSVQDPSRRPDLRDAFRRLGRDARASTVTSRVPRASVHARVSTTGPSKPHLGAHPPRTCARARPSCFQEQPSSFFPPCQAEESDSKPCARREVPTKVEFQVPPRAPRDRCLRRSEARLESSSPSTRGDGPRPPGARHALHVAAAEGTWTQERGTWTGRTAGETPGRSET